MTALFPAYNLSQCDEIEGVGFVVESPDVSVAYDSQSMGRDLEFRVEGACDTVLLVNAPDGGWHFNDDTNELDPAILLPGAESGRYDIWIGTLDTETCNAVLTAETFDPS